jgi:hypothetical protein
VRAWGARMPPGAAGLRLRAWAGEQGRQLGQRSGGSER